MKLKGLILAGLILAVLLPIYYFPKVITINLINCRSQYGPCDSVVSESLDKLIGSKYGNVTEKMQDILGNNLLIEDYSYQFKLPDKLTVNILQRKTQFALKKEDNENLFLIDKEGIVVDTGSFSNLPTLQLDGNIPNVGEKISDDIAFTLDVFNDLYKLYQINIGNLYSNYSEFRVPGGYTVIFPTTGEKEILIGSMLVILNQLNNGEQDSRIENVKEMKTIDLRYKNPVIK